MANNIDFSLFLQNLWERENMQGYNKVEGKGGYSNGRYYAYDGTNGRDVGPGFLVKNLSPSLRKKAETEGFTEQELNAMVKDSVDIFLPVIYDRIRQYGGNPYKLSNEALNGMLDMRWQLGDEGFKKYKNFWNAAAQEDYEGMRRESKTRWHDETGWHDDLGRWKFRKEAYFKDPEKVVTPIVPLPPITEHPDALRVSRPVFMPLRRTKGLGGNLFETDGGSLYHPKLWNDLSMREKAEMMKVAVMNGITNLQDIRQKYNEFAEGGYVPSDHIKDRITHYEGKAMTGAVDPLSGKWGKNSNFESEAARFYSVLPDSIRDRVLGNQALADSLYSYSYNVGAGNFKKRVVPALERYYSGEGSVRDIEDSMWASGDKKLRGLRLRRAEEKAGVRNALMNGLPSVKPTIDYPVYTLWNPPTWYDSNSSVAEPVDVHPASQTVGLETHSPREAERRKRQEALRKLNVVSSLLHASEHEDGLLGAFSTLMGYPLMAGGGHLYGGETEDSQQMNTDSPNIFRYADGRYVYQETPGGEEIDVTPVNTLMPDPSQWTYQDASGKVYTPRTSQTTTATITQGEEKSPLMRTVDNYFSELAWRAKNDPSSILLQGKYTMPAIASTLLPALGSYAASTSIAGVPTMTWANTALTSGFAGHGMYHTLFEGLNGWGDGAMTALEIAPLGSLARPMYKEAATAIENYRYPFGRPRIPEGFNTTYGDYNYYHGGLDSDFDFTKLDVFRRGSKQAKRGKDYAGFYMTNSQQKPQAFGYGAGEAHGIRIANDAKTLRLDKNIERIPADELRGYREQGYDLVTGRNVFGQPEYILLNKDAIQETHFFSEAPKNELFMRKAPKDIFEAKLRKSPIVEWADAVKSSQITAENAAQWAESKVAQRSIGNSGASSSSIESTIDAAIRGRDKLLNWIKDPFYKQRIEEEPMFRYADDIVNDAEDIIKM